MKEIFQFFPLLQITDERCIKGRGFHIFSPPTRQEQSTQQTSKQAKQPSKHNHNDPAKDMSRTARGGDSIDTAMNSGPADFGAPMDGAMDSGPANFGGGVGHGRLQLRQARVSRPSDVHPALKEWLYQEQSPQAALFALAEEKTKLDREKVGGTFSPSTSLPLPIAFSAVLRAVRSSGGVPRDWIWRWTAVQSHRIRLPCLPVCDRHSHGAQR